MENQKQTIIASAQTQQKKESDIVQAFVPTKNLPALFGYYCSIFGLIPFFGLFLSIAGIILGIIGMKKDKATPTPGAKAHAMVAIILGIIGTVVSFLILLLVVFSMYSASTT